MRPRPWYEQRPHYFGDEMLSLYGGPLDEVVSALFPEPLSPWQTAPPAIGVAVETCVPRTRRHPRGASWGEGCDPNAPGRYQHLEPLAGLVAELAASESPVFELPALNRADCDAGWRVVRLGSARRAIDDQIDALVRLEERVWVLPSKELLQAGESLPLAAVPLGSPLPGPAEADLDETLFLALMV